MRYYVTLLALLFSCGTAPQKQESSSTSQNAPEPESLAELLSETEQRQDSIHNPSHEIADEKPKREVQPDSTRCSIKMLVYVDQNFGDLTRQDINSFLKIFHQECKSNVEFSEWSNELLFKVLDSYTETTLNLIATKKGYDLSAILDELEYPIHDGIRPQPLIEKIEGMVNNDSTTNKVIKSLTVAASKY